MKTTYFHSLFVKAVVVLGLISLVPVLFIGYRFLRINERLLESELLQKQQTIAGRLATAIRSNISSKEQLLAEFGDLHTDFGNHRLITPTDLSYLQARNPSLFYLMALTRNGALVFDTGTQPQDNYAAVHKAMLETCLEGTRFISPVYYQDGKPFIWLAQPLHRHAGETTVTGVLAAALYVEEISKSLLQIYPLDMDALLVSSQGALLSYNGAPEGVATPDVSAQLHQTLTALSTQLADRDSGLITLPDGQKLLASVIHIAWLNWDVYVYEPGNLPLKLLLNSLFHFSLWDVFWVVGVMLLFVGIVSYLVIIPITHPLARLRDAVVKQREKEDFVVREEDLQIPHNEIGDLAKVFVEMSQTLHKRREELMGTQQELARMNQVLEKRVEERTRELQKATQELVKSERLVAIGQMASIISHEIRNPLAVISNATRLIKTLTHSTDKKVIKQFSIIEAEIHQANGIISEVLGYARTRELMLSMVDVNSFLRELVASYPAHPGITLKEELDPESVRVKVDGEEIKQALRNLISNAVESMPAGGTVTVGSKVGKQVVCLYVADEGTGIKDEIRWKIFSPFYTTKARGTGLGLAVVRKAVSRHRGKLMIHSVLGKGTCFQIYLKIYRKAGDTTYGEAS